MNNAAAVIRIPAPVADTYTGPGRPHVRKHDWPEIAEIAPTLAATMLRYLDQIALSLRPASVSSAEGILRRFAGWLTANHPDIGALVEVDRHHIEDYKAYLPTRPGSNGAPPLSDASIRLALGTLRTFFERTSEWGYDDAPTRVLVFNGDLPTPDDPLPKFLSDADAGKLMRAAADAHPTRRLVIEMLARTGLRVGELCALPADAVVLMSGRHWLRVPVGKLHNDRYVPLHPQLVELLDAHHAKRNDDIDRLIVWNNGPLNRHQIARMLRRVAKAAGIGHVHPHQLRHTLATQAKVSGVAAGASLRRSRDRVAAWGFGVERAGGGVLLGAVDGCLTWASTGAVAVDATMWHPVVEVANGRNAAWDSRSCRAQRVWCWSMVSGCCTRPRRYSRQC